MRTLVSHPSGLKSSAETKTATAVGDFSAYKRRATEDGGRRDDMETASLYFHLMDQFGHLKIGSRNICDIEARRKSLIAENELKLSLERKGLAGDLSYLVGHRHRAAAIGWARRRIARLKSENNYWRNAPVETRAI